MRFRISHRWIGAIAALCFSCIPAVHAAPSPATAPIGIPVAAVPPTPITQQRLVTLELEATQLPADLLSRARSIAKSTIAAAFQTQPQLMHFTLHLVGARSGQQVPLMTITLSRQEWEAGLFDRRLQDAGISASLLLEGQGRSIVQASHEQQPIRRGRGGRNRRQLLTELNN
jgi:hypothetical protein